jgi:tRNA A37 N6-isopentenylltransferase MiaA
LDVGTAKPTREQRERVPHHLIDVADPEEPFAVARYQALAREAIDGIRARGRRVLLAGGSGLYLRAVADDLDLPGTDPGIRARLEADAERVGAAGLYERLAANEPAAAERIEPAEVRGHVDRGFGRWLTASQAIGYAEFARHLAGESTLADAVAGTIKRTKALARRQLAWFRRDPRIRWFDAGPVGAESVVDDVEEYLRG